MTLQLISANAIPAYIAESSDISGSACSGAALIGKTIFTKDDAKWYIIISSGCVATYKFPV